MYKFEQNQSIQVSRRIYDESRGEVVFHVVMTNPLNIDSIDQVELRDGECRLLYNDNGYVSPSGSVLPTGYTDAMAAGLSTEEEMESYLRSIGALPPAWEPA